METYGFGRRKKKKIWLIPLIIIGAVLVFIYAVGIIISVTNADRDKIARSVSENAVLKEQINSLNMQISDMQRKIDSLNEYIAGLPTPTPAPEVGTEQENGGTSPRTE